MLEQRIIELETRLAFQEDQLDQLSQIISKQQIELVESRKLTQLFMGRVQELIDSSEGAADPSAQPPPHY